MVATSNGTHWFARQRFEQAHRRGKWWQIIAWPFQRRVTLHGLDDVHRNVRITNATDWGLCAIKVAAIDGSVRRRHDYIATFLPHKEHLVERWTSILVAMERMEPLPAIEVYKVDDQYYIIDGHHRVSVAKFLGIQEITAHVIELQTASRTQTV